MMIENTVLVVTMVTIKLLTTNYSSILEVFDAYQPIIFLVLELLCVPYLPHFTSTLQVKCFQY